MVIPFLAVLLVVASTGAVAAAEAPDLAAVLRRRRDRALLREACEASVRALKRARPDLYFRRPR